MRLGAFAEKPFLVRDKIPGVLPGRDHRVGAKERGDEAFALGTERAALKAGAGIPGLDRQIGKVQPEIEKGDGRAATMQGAGDLGAAQDAEDRPGPVCIVEFKRHAGDDQEQEARHDQEMEEALKGGEAGEPNVPLLRFDLGFAEGLGVVQIEIAGAKEPQGGVRAKEGEDADEQRGHRHEGPMQLRKMFGIQRVGVGNVFGEAGGGAGMALFAGGHNVALGKVRGRVGGRLHVVVAVAAVAGGDFGDAMSLAQRHGFAMIGLAVVGQAVLVTAPALFIAPGVKVAAAGRFNLMSGVAIGADRAGEVALGENLAVDAGVVGFFDAQMARAAGGGDVGMIDRRTAVHAALDVVNAVAVVAGGGGNQSAGQRPSVNALGILRSHLRIFHLVLRGDAAVAVAFGAG